MHAVELLGAPGSPYTRKMLALLGAGSNRFALVAFAVLVVFVPGHVGGSDQTNSLREELAAVGGHFMR